MLTRVSVDGETVTVTEGGLTFAVYSGALEIAAERPPGEAYRTDDPRTGEPLTIYAGVVEGGRIFAVFTDGRDEPVVFPETAL